MSKRFGPIFAAQDYAGFWRRTIALLIDFGLLLALRYGASYGWYYFAPMDWVTPRAYAVIDAA